MMKDIASKCRWSF